MLAEAFVAYLYGRTGGLTSKDILDRVEVMPSRDFAQVLRVMADRLDTAKNAPVIVERGKGEWEEEPQPLELVLDVDAQLNGEREEWTEPEGDGATRENL